jgi:hypothetical protein
LSSRDSSLSKDIIRGVGVVGGQYSPLFDMCYFTNCVKKFISHVELNDLFFTYRCELEIKYNCLVRD